jgi:hypothetical protein
MPKKKPDPFDLAYPEDFDEKNVSELARIAVEFSAQPRLRDHDDLLKGDPPSRTVWTVRLGRLALRRDGKWAYHSRASSDSDDEHLRFVQMQRFVSLEEAARVATEVFGKEPEHAGWMRSLYAEREKDHG